MGSLSPSIFFGASRIRPRVADYEGSLMLRSRKTFWWAGLVASLIAAVLHCDPREARGDVTSEEVEHAIRDGVRYLKESKRPTARGPTSTGRAHRDDESGHARSDDRGRETEVARDSARP